MKRDHRLLLFTIPVIIFFMLLPVKPKPFSLRAKGLSVAHAQDIEMSPTPTANRLAEPTLPANYNQADEGAQDFWLYCLPCHGDRGQGLTEEFRLLYPPEDRNCWDSGCHGNRPYENGFKLPGTVPPIIGGGSNLKRFNTARNLFAYIKFAMPYNDPTSLEDELYWRLTAFLIRENDLASLPDMLCEENAESILINGSERADLQSETPVLQLPRIRTTPIFESEKEGDEMARSAVGGPKVPVLMIIFGIICLIMLALGFLFVFRRPSK